MEGRKFIDIAKTFTKEEIKSFKKFIASPFYNSNDSVVKAFDFIRKYSKDLTAPLPTKESVHEKVYPSKEYKDENIRYLLSELLQLSEEFLSLMNLNKRKAELKKGLLAELNERGLEKIFERNLRSTFELIEEINPNDPYYHKVRSEVLEEERLFNSKRVEFLKDGVEDKAFSLTRFYVIEILKEYRYLINQNIHPNSTQEKIPFKDEVMKFAKENEFLNVPLIEILYYQLLTLIEPESTDHYYKLKEITNNYADKLTYVEKYNSYVMLLNYSNRKAGQGIEEFRREKFELHKASAKNNAIAKEIYIAPLRFEAIVEDGLRLKEYDWSEGFIMNYKHMLPEEEREEMVHYCFAHIAYCKGDNEQALEFLSKSNFSHITMNIRKRNLALKVYYELDHLEMLASHVDSYKHYLSRNEKLMPKDVYVYYTGTLKVIPDLIKLKSLPDENKIELLKLKMEKLGRIYEKAWLMEKIRMIEGRKMYQKKV